MQDYLDYFTKKVDSWKQGQNPWVRIPTDEKKAPWRRVRANVYFGDPKAHWATHQPKTGDD